MANLTLLRLEAIIDALGQSLAGAIETDVSRAEYEQAREWAEGEVAKRKGKVRRRPPGNPQQFGGA